MAEEKDTREKKHTQGKAFYLGAEQEPTWGPGSAAETKHRSALPDRKDRKVPHKTNGWPKAELQGSGGQPPRAEPQYAESA